MAQTATQTPSKSPSPTTTSPASGDFCWFEVNTRDVEGVKAFYNKLFGWTTSPSQMGGGVYHHWHDKNGVMFGGIMNMNGPEWEGVPAHWMSYVRVDDCDKKAAAVTNLGGKICVPPTAIPTVGKFCVINDPTGGTISLIALETPKPIAAVIAWNELMTRDSKKATEFYTKLLGWTTDAMPMGGGVPYMICKSNGKSVGGIFNMDDPKFENVPPCWMNYIDTQAVDADAAKVEKLGGKIIQPPTDIPNNIGRFCVIADPGGAHVAMYQSA